MPWYFTSSSMAFNRKARLQANIDAIRTAFAVWKEVRIPTEAERETISRYCGFGGLKCVLNPVENKAVWPKNDLPLYDLTAELHRVIRENSEDETDYKRYVASMKQSVLTAFYTPKEIPEAIWSVFGEMNLKPQKVLEPSAGMGVFIDTMRTVNPDAEVTAFEKDKLTGLLLTTLHKDDGTKVRTAGFEMIDKEQLGTYDLAISNIPFGDTKVYDPFYSDSKSLFNRVISKSIHGYFMQKGLDAVRDGGMVAFITTRNYLDREQNCIRINHLLQQADLVTAFRLPDNLFKENANTEAGSDLIIIQKNYAKQGLTEDEERLKRVYSAEDENIVRNDYFEHYPDNVLATSILRGHDQYGKPALEYLHTGGVEGIAHELRERLRDELAKHLDFRKFTGLDSPAFIRKEKENKIQKSVEKQKPAEEQESIEAEQKPVETGQQHVTEDEPAKTAQIVTIPEPAKKEEKPVPEHTPDNNPQLSLFDLWGMTVQEQPKPNQVPKKPKKERKKERQARKLQEKKAAMEKKSHIDQQLAVYDSLDWEENPPINGFYEMMMDLTPERRRQLLEAGQQRIETNADAKAREQGQTETEPKQRRTTKTKLVEPKPFEGEMKAYYRNGSMVEDKDGNIGHLEKITSSGATFVPLIVSQEQTDRIRQYIAVRDVYEELYAYEQDNQQANDELREKLNGYYDAFTAMYGNLNDRKNVRMILMDAVGRNMLALERGENGRFVKADFLDHPVAFSTQELKHVDTSQEAVSASLNKYGVLNMPYMSYLTDKSEDDIIRELQGQIFYNPLTDFYEIRDKFIAGNVVEKVRDIENLIEKRGGEVDDRIMESLKALKDAVPTPIPFEDLDFNFGERWIPANVYSAFMTDFFDTKVDIVYSPQRYDGIALLRHALHNTTPKIMKSNGKDDNGNDIKVPDAQAIQLANSKIDEIRNGFTEWLESQNREFKDRLAQMYNEKFNCFVRPKYDGSHQTFPDLDMKGLELRYGISSVYPSQKDCVWMIKQNGGGICDHQVGTGKTLIMCIAAHEMKRLGMAKKPMIIGLKANVAEIAATYQTAYPNARILYASEKDFSTENRVKFFHSIKNNDFDQS